MNITARKYERRRQANQRAAQLQEDERTQEAEQLKKHLKAAIKALRYGPDDIQDLTPARQLEILEEYALHLEAEMADFAATWGNDGHSGLTKFRIELSGVLETIARLRIMVLQGAKE